MGNKDVGGWLMQISFENCSIVNLFLCVWVTQSQLNTLGYQFCRQSLRYCLWAIAISQAADLGFKLIFG